MKQTTRNRCKRTRSVFLLITTTHMHSFGLCVKNKYPGTQQHLCFWIVGAHSLTRHSNSLPLWYTGLVLLSMSAGKTAILALHNVSWMLWCCSQWFGNVCIGGNGCEWEGVQAFRENLCRHEENVKQTEKQNKKTVKIWTGNQWAVGWQH